MKRTKDEVRQLIRQPLTARERGLIVFEDSWISTKDPEEAYLTDGNIETLKAGLVGLEDDREYMAIIRLYRTADFIERQAKVELLLACTLLERLIGLSYFYGLSREQGKISEEQTRTFLETRANSTVEVRSSIRKMQAGRQVLMEIGAVVGMALQEEIDIMMDVLLRPALRQYGKITFAIKFLDVTLSVITMDKCQATASELNNIRSWMVDELGENWWTELDLDKPLKSVLPESVKQYWWRLTFKGKIEVTRIRTEVT